MKFYNYKFLRVLFSNRTKVSQSIFGPKFRDFLCFRKSLQLEKFEGADFKYDNGFLKFKVKNTQIRPFWCLIKKFLFFRKILRIDKFDGADLKFDNSFFKILAQKNLNKRLLLIVAKILYLSF